VGAATGIADAYMAVADGSPADRRDIENAVRRSLRGEWGQEGRRGGISVEIADSLVRTGAPERAV